MYKVLLPILLATCYLLLATDVYAAEVSLAITPPRIVIQTEAPATITKQIQLTNKTDQSVNLDIKFEPFTQAESQNGKVAYTTDNKTYFEKIQIYDNDNKINSLTLSPKQTKNLNLLLDLPENEPNKDYYFSILFISKNVENSNATPKDKIRAYTNIEPAIAANVLLSIFTGKKEPQGIIDTYNAPLFIQNGAVPLSIAFKNTGDYLLVPEGTILIRNMFNQAVGKITIPKTFVLAKTTRVISVEWQEPILIGPYTAELMLTTDDKSIFFKRSTMFIGLPLPVIGGIIVVIITLVLLQKRVSSHFS